MAYRKHPELVLILGGIVGLLSLFGVAYRSGAMVRNSNRHNLIKSDQSPLDIAEGLLATLKNERRRDKERLQAAHLLGKCRYKPAIPALIDNIKLVSGDGNDFKYWDNPAAFEYPIVKILRSYGMDAVPYIVDAYLERRNVSKRLTLREVLYFNKEAAESAKKYAIERRPYLKGRFAEQDVRKFVRFCDNIIKELQSSEPNPQKLTQPVIGDQD